MIKIPFTKIPQIIKALISKISSLWGMPKGLGGFTGSNRPAPPNYFLQPGYIVVTKEPTLISMALGSCVAICIYDQKRKCVGMNHFQLPSVDEQDRATARFGNVATHELILMMMKEGSKVEHLEAQIFGGTHDPKVSSSDIGSENIKIARKVLAKAHIRVVSEDVGGEKLRKVFFNTVTNEVAVIKADKIWKMN